MNEIELAKFLRKMYDDEVKKNDDFINLVYEIDNLDELDINKITEECSKLNLTFMTCNDAAYLSKNPKTKEMYLKQGNKFIFYDCTDNTKGFL